MITRSTVKPATNAARGPIRLPQSKRLGGGGSDSIVEAGFVSGIPSVFRNSTGPQESILSGCNPWTHPLGTVESASREKS
jgi:hypothetical protein